MENTQEQLQRLTKTPNRSTRQLQQIKRTDLVVQTQTAALGSAKTSADKLSKEYEKLIKATRDAKTHHVSRPKATTVQNTDYVLQHTAELVDQQLRVLEKTKEILEANKRLYS